MKVAGIVTDFISEPLKSLQAFLLIYAHLTPVIIT